MPAGLVDLLDDEAGIPGLMARARTPEDPVELLGLPATCLRRTRRQVAGELGRLAVMRTR